MSIFGGTTKVNETYVTDFDAQTQAREGAVALTGEGNSATVNYQTIDAGAVRTARDVAITGIVNSGQVNASLAGTYAAGLDDIANTSFDFGEATVESALTTVAGAQDSIAELYGQTLTFAANASDSALSVAAGAVQPSRIDPQLIKLASMALAGLVVVKLLK